MDASAETPRPPLDDIMLSMDVVDTLRQDERIALRELSDEARRKQLIDRVREIYRGQGIDVPDHILEEGVRALEERRFIYEPPRASLQVRLARLYVSRWHWGKWLGGGLAALVILWIGWQAFYVWPQAAKEQRTRVELTETLPRKLNTVYATIEAETDTAGVLERAAQLRDSGIAAAKAGQRVAAHKATDDLEALLEELRLAYEIRIVSRSGELSGLWRIPRVNPDSRNYYLVVEAIDPAGTALARPVVNEENGKRETVTIWAVRVSKAVFDEVQADKLDDGIIQDPVVGVKRRGELDIRWRVDTQGGALTQW
jgi:hypothetical protein